jgi:hypothetical protein
MLKWFTKRLTPSIPDTWETFELGHVVCRWTHPDGKQRVYLIARHDGGFSCGSEYFSEEENEMCWIPQGSAGSVYGSEEIAVREIHGSFPWSRDVIREERSNDLPVA